MVADVLLHPAAHCGGCRGFACEFEQEFRDMAALDAVAAQQWLRLADAARDECKLPGEIECVLHAGVHPLAARGAVHMRRVAGDEDAA